MDFSPILINFLTSFWYFIPLFILIALFKSPWFKGIFGEAQVNLAAKLFLNKSDYHLIKNVTLPTEDGTTQIDHIIASRYGLFVIETKNMKGWVFGSPSQKTWTQKIYRHTSNFQNPLHQNYKHTKTLQSCLGLSEDVVFSLIVFIGDSTFKTEMPENVTYAWGYLRFIKSKKNVLLTNDEVSRIVRLIEGGRLTPSFETQRQHVKNVKSRLENKENSNLCPKCGSELVLRIAKKGANKGNEFMACSGFPKCRYAKNAL